MKSCGEGKGEVREDSQVAGRIAKAGIQEQKRGGGAGLGSNANFALDM